MSREGRRRRPVGLTVEQAEARSGAIAKLADDQSAPLACTGCLFRGRKRPLPPTLGHALQRAAAENA